MKILLFTILVASGTMAAEATQARAAAGVTAFADDGTLYHAAVGGAVRVYLSRRWSMEPEYLYLSRAFDRHHALWGNFTYDFRDRERRVIPYWMASPGFIVNSARFGSRNFVTSEAAFSTGGGVRAFLSERVFVAPQFRAGVADGIFAEFTFSVGYAWKR